MQLNKLAEDSLKNVKRRTGKYEITPNDFVQKAYEEILEWQKADNHKSTHCPELTEDEEETADVIMVMLSYSASMGYDIEKILKVKHEFNLKRQ